MFSMHRLTSIVWTRTAPTSTAFCPNVPDQGDIWIGASVSVHRPGLAGIQILAHVTNGVDRGVGDIAIDDVKVGDGHANAPNTERAKRDR